MSVLLPFSQANNYLHSYRKENRRFNPAPSHNEEIQGKKEYKRKYKRELISKICLHFLAAQFERAGNLCKLRGQTGVCFSLSLIALFKSVPNK